MTHTDECQKPEKGQKSFPSVYTKQKHTMSKEKQNTVLVLKLHTSDNFS